MKQTGVGGKPTARSVDTVPVGHAANAVLSYQLSLEQDYLAIH